MKGLFWKHVLTPSRLNGIGVLWLFDADVAMHPAVMPLGELVSALLSTDASAMQPHVRSAGAHLCHRYRPGAWWCDQRHLRYECVALCTRLRSE